MANKLPEDLSKEQLVNMYRQMVLIRRFEEKTSEMYHQGHISGYCHLYIGQEAVGVGTLTALRPDDYVIGAYRDHGHALLKGCDPKHVMAELFGKATGVAKGKGGSMHMFNKDTNFLGGDGIVAGEMPVATGLAFAVEYKGSDQIVFCFFGDGAVNEGAFHESMNLASLWNLPIIFLCENNEWGMGTPVAKASVSIELTERACGYKMRTEKVDGMDLIATYEMTKVAAEYCRSTRRPIFVEVLTQRFVGHSVTDPQIYRTREEINRAKERDPIRLYRQLLIDTGTASKEQLDELDNQALKEVEEATQFALDSPFPDHSELCTDLWETTDFGDSCRI